MTRNDEHPLSIRHYYVDEAGDAVLFSRNGRIIVGTEGCSRFFILSLLDVAEPEALAQDMEALRAALLADPYFKNVPSMQPEAKKTALAFHAKDDVPEVRREVFRLLLHHQLRFFAVVHDKAAVLQYVRQRNARDPSYRYHPDELYDYQARRLFRDVLHKEDSYSVVFARRGRSDRTAALQAALETARRRFTARWGIASHALVHVMACRPAGCAGLQAADYFLWALQRLYERREERYVELLWSAFSVVQDVDDTRQASYGAYYTQKKPLRLAALRDQPGI